MLTFNIDAQHQEPQTKITGGLREGVREHEELDQRPALLQTPFPTVKMLEGRLCKDLAHDHMTEKGCANSLSF
ncbi:hypothetical protein CEXT_364171 [Caerostris extrusa]|uniref:Uncharacterized protein n=1 Tax=Caerostris extrusa TaxID=172846 RepID=A0AAV4SFU3_CAEEX|nr:hypothetical protein CEXT_364171 [Caerostris extrusa]